MVTSFRTNDRLHNARGFLCRNAEQLSCSPLTTHHSPLTPHHSPLTTHPSPLTTHLSPPTTHPSPLTTHRSPLTPHHSPLTAHHSPLTPHPSPLTAHHCYCRGSWHFILKLCLQQCCYQWQMSVCITVSVCMCCAESVVRCKGCVSRGGLCGVASGCVGGGGGEVPTAVGAETQAVGVSGRCHMQTDRRTYKPVCE